jgi:hypothetical protein
MTSFGLADAALIQATIVSFPFKNSFEQSKLIFFTIFNDLSDAALLLEEILDPYSEIFEPLKIF